MTPSDALVRRDLDQVPAVERRLARLTLQFVLSDGALRKRLSDSDFTTPLWTLTQCPLEPAALGFFDAALAPKETKLNARVRNALRALATEIEETDSDNNNDTDNDEDDEEAEWLLHSQRGKRERARPRQRRLRLFYAGLSRAVLEPLIAADGEEAVMPLASLLERCLDLPPAGVKLLDSLILREHNKALRQLLNAARLDPYLPSEHRADIAALLGIDEQALRPLLTKDSPLRALGLMDHNRSFHTDLEDYVSASDLLRELIDPSQKTSQHCSRSCLSRLLRRTGP
ncbi:MAG: hypothetical protein VBE63_23940 [Lamprobacter sp.]|uniref:hypothetical protein n=1 Tax=Lamprobacter sp. TaxID=3100796 RepID=UPI002B262E1F|nr:hypothetical protein [Lamprobacter sp.]MEA3642967.1 hypothetical protein [Lamprobacter sp.]